MESLLGLSQKPMFFAPEERDVYSSNELKTVRSVGVRCVVWISSTLHSHRLLNLRVHILNLYGTPPEREIVWVAAAVNIALLWSEEH